MTAGVDSCPVTQSVLWSSICGSCETAVLGSGQHTLSLSITLGLVLPLQALCWHVIAGPWSNLRADLVITHAAFANMFLLKWISYTTVVLQCQHKDVFT